MVDDNVRSGQLRPEETRFLPLPDVMRRCGISRSHIYGAIKLGTFPAPVKISSSSRWLEHEINSWLAERVRERDAKAAA